MVYGVYEMDIVIILQIMYNVCSIAACSSRVLRCVIYLVCVSGAGGNMEYVS